MSIFACALTGEPLQHAVVSRKTGILFQRDAIEQHLENSSECPITHQPLSTSDLITVSTQQQPIHTNQPSNSFASIKTQYDILSVDAFKLRKSIAITFEELTHSLGQNEAAYKTIAKLVKQNEDNEHQIEKLSARIEELKSNN